SPRCEIVDYGEDSLFHLAGVFGAEYDQLASFEVKRDTGRGSHSRGEAVRGKCSGVINGEVRFADSCQLLLARPDEHRVHEKRVIGARTDDPHPDTILRIPAGKTVETIEPLARVQIVNRSLAIDREGPHLAGYVHRTPPDFLLGFRVLHHSLVL